MAQIAGLNHFQIKGNGSPNDKVNCPVYKNGRQQIQVDIVIDAYDTSGQIIPVTLTQLKTVKLIDYDSGSIVDGQLPRSYTKNVFDFYGGALKLDTGSVNQNMSVLRFYISVPSSANFPQKQVAAEITLDGATYRTNDHNVSPGGSFNNGGFNSSILVMPLPTYTFEAQMFKIVNLRTIAYAYAVGGSGEERWLYKWEITFIDSSYRIVASDISAPPVLNWFSQYVRKGDDKDTGHWALPVLGVGERIMLGALKTGSSNNDVYIWPYTRAGAAYAIHEEAKWFETHQYVSKHITYYDHNGCEHSVYLVPNNNGTTFQLMDKAP